MASDSWDAGCESSTATESSFRRAPSICSWRAETGAGTIPNRASIVVGAGTSIGRAIAELLARTHGPCVLLDRDLETLSYAYTRTAETNGLPFEVVEGNPADPAVGEGATRLSEERFEGVSTVVIVLPPSTGTPFRELPLGDWPATQEDLLRPFHSVVGPAVRSMASVGHGRVISTVWGSWLGEASSSVSATCSGAVLGYTRALALEAGRKGITVNAIALSAMADEAAPDENSELVARTTAVRRPGTPADAAAAVGFLVSDDAAFITGQMINVCGGSSIGKASY